MINRDNVSGSGRQQQPADDRWTARKIEDPATCHTRPSRRPYRRLRACGRRERKPRWVGLGGVIRRIAESDVRSFDDAFSWYERQVPSDIRQ